MVRRRRNPEVLDTSGLQAVTEFNQWLRGLDPTAVRLWQTASDEARAASAMGSRVGLFFVGATTALLATGLVLLSGAPDARTDFALMMIGGAGVFVALAGTGAVRDAKKRHDTAARTRILLEHKLGFLHEQLEGHHVSPAGARRRDAEGAMRGQRVSGFGAPGLRITLLVLAALHGVVAASGLLSGAT